VKVELPTLSRKIGLNLEYFLSSGSWVAARYIFLGLLSLGISIAFARLSTAELYGKYHFTLAVINFLSLLSLPGLNTMALIAAAKGSPQTIIATTRIGFRMSWLMSALAVLIGIYYLLVQLQPGLGWALIGASAFLPFFFGPNAWYAYYEGDRRDFRSTTVRIILANGLVFLALLVGLWQDWSLPALVTIYFAVNAALTVWFYQEVRKKITEIKPVKINIWEGIRYTSQKSSTTLPETIQPVVISTLLGFDQLGIFMIAYTLVHSASGLLGALSATYFPLLVSYKKILHGRIVWQTIGLGLFVAITYWLFVTLMFRPLYGERFHESFQLAQYFAPVVALIPLKLYLANYFTTHDQPSFVARANTASYTIALAVFLVVGAIKSLTPSLPTMPPFSSRRS